MNDYIRTSIMNAVRKKMKEGRHEGRMEGGKVRMDR